MNDDDDYDSIDTIEAIGDQLIKDHHEACPINKIGQELRADARAERERMGPSKVTSNAYRTGWDTIFGKKQTVGQA